MPRRELKFPHQVENWLIELSEQLTQPGQLILIGSGALLWHASANKAYGRLTVVVPAVADLLVPKRKRNEPRDREHAAWVERVGLLQSNA